MTVILLLVSLVLGGAIGSGDLDLETSWGSASDAEYDTDWSYWDDFGDWSDYLEGTTGDDSWGGFDDSWGGFDDSWGTFDDSWISWDGWDIEWSAANIDDTEWSYTDWSWDDQTGWSSWGTFDLINITKYWTDDASLNWCYGSWRHDRVTDTNWNWVVEDFILSGEITVWCVKHSQVFVVSDLRYRDLNRVEELPSMFGMYNKPCSREMCHRQLADKRQGMGIEEMIKRVWGYLEIFKQLDCPECFCDDPAIREELETVTAVTKDFLKVFNVLNHSTDNETPEDVLRYFVELKTMLLLYEESHPENTHDTEGFSRPLITLMDMETAMAGPGAAVMDITRLRELERGVEDFCSP